MFTTRKINDISVKPVISHKNETKKNVRAFDYYPSPYSNICLLARKASGKSTVIYRALEQCVTKGTNVFIFSPTVHIDPTYAKMIAMLKKKKCIVVAKEHFMENGVDLIGELLTIKFGKTDSEEQQKEEEELVNPPMMAFPNDPNFRVVNPQFG